MAVGVRARGPAAILLVLAALVVLSVLKRALERLAILLALRHFVGSQELLQIVAPTWSIWMWMRSHSVGFTTSCERS